MSGIPDIKSLKETFREECRDHERATGINVIKGLVALHGYARSSAYAWTEEQGSAHLPIEAVQHAALDYGLMATIKALVHNVGLLCFERPKALRRGADVSSVVRQSSRVVTEYLDARVDGQWNASEIVRFESECDKLIEAVASARANASHEFINQPSEHIEEFKRARM